MKDLMYQTIFFFRNDITKIKNKAMKKTSGRKYNESLKDIQQKVKALEEAGQLDVWIQILENDSTMTEFLLKLENDLSSAHDVPRDTISVIEELINYDNWKYSDDYQAIENMITSRKNCSQCAACNIVSLIKMKIQKIENKTKRRRRIDFRVREEEEEDTVEEEEKEEEEEEGFVEQVGKEESEEEEEGCVADYKSKRRRLLQRSRNGKEISAGKEDDEGGENEEKEKPRYRRISEIRKRRTRDRGGRAGEEGLDVDAEI